MKRIEVNTIDGYNESMWVYITCPECGRETQITISDTVLCRCGNWFSDRGLEDEPLPAASKEHIEHRALISRLKRVEKIILNSINATTGSNDFASGRRAGLRFALNELECIK